LTEPSETTALPSECLTECSEKQERDSCNLAVRSETTTHRYQYFLEPSYYSGEASGNLTKPSENPGWAASNLVVRSEAAASLSFQIFRHSRVYKYYE